MNWKQLIRGDMSTQPCDWTKLPRCPSVIYSGMGKNQNHQWRQISPNWNPLLEVNPWGQGETTPTHPPVAGPIPKQVFIKFLSNHIITWQHKVRVGGSRRGVNGFGVTVGGSARRHRHDSTRPSRLHATRPKKGAFLGKNSGKPWYILANESCLLWGVINHWEQSSQDSSLNCYLHSIRAKPACHLLVCHCKHSNKHSFLPASDVGVISFCTQRQDWCHLQNLQSMNSWWLYEIKLGSLFWPWSLPNCSTANSP